MSQKEIPSKVGAIFGMKCPRCHQGDLFETGSFSFNKAFEMNEVCAGCGQKFMAEPGFYYGAMFISYGITGWLFLGVVSALIWGAGLSINAAFGILLVFAAIFYVYFFRISRAIWIHIVVRFDKKIAQEVFEQQR